MTGRGARRCDRGDRGAAAMELALVVMPFLCLVFGVVQYGFYLYATEAGTAAVGEAVRRLAVGECEDTSQLKQFLASRLGAASTDRAADLQTTVTYSDQSSPPASTPAPGVVGGTVTLTLAFRTVDMPFPFIPLPGGGKVTRTGVGRVESTATTTNGCL